MKYFYLCRRFLYQHTDMSKLKQAWMYIRRHKYLITIVAFVLIIGVLDKENSLMQRVAHWKEIRELNTEIQRYKKQYEEDSRMLKELTSNPEALEKVAREKYLMKKADEDIYVFEEDLEKSND